MPRAGVGVRRGALRVDARAGAVLVSPRVQVSEMQRSRLFAAAIVTVEELGWARASVAHITSRARVSRRTFYDLFENREDCLLAVMQEAIGRVERELVLADLGGLRWQERVRRGLWTILSFFDRDPALAWLCVVQSARGSRRVLECREDILRRLAGVIDEGRGEQGVRTAQVPSLTAEGLVGAAASIVYSRLLRGEREPLSGLLGVLMAMIVLPYLGPAAARREQSRPLPSLTTGEPVAQDANGALIVDRDPWQELSIRLTYRTARVLEVVAEHPGTSNRRVGEHAGITDQGQVSKLLARLQRVGLLANTGEGHATGRPNAWELTPTGQQVAQTINTHSHDMNEAVAS
jgi:AcrR family transcriptional regulator/DNA-binding MarR family transcriptional regulator